MPYLRIHTTQKKTDHEEFLTQIFSTDPNPATRTVVRPATWADAITADSTPGFKMVKEHDLSHLPGGPGKYTYTDQTAANLALFYYALEFYQLANSGDIMLRYNKVGADGKLLTYIVVSSKTVWDTSVSAVYNTLTTQISELFEISNSENEISEIEYNTLVSDIYTDIDNMKINSVGQCRLDFIK
jgi:hypothetical protein